MLVLGVSCARKEMDVPVREASPVFYASIEQPSAADTKVYADENLCVLWHAGDQVSVFNRYTYNEQYQFMGETGDTAGTFEEVSSGSFVTGNELPHVYSVYPYRKANRISNEGVMSVAVPTQQAYAVKSFDPAANIMVSVTDDTKLLFKNAGSFLALKLYGKGVKVASVTLKGNDEEVVAGNATVKMVPGGVPALEMFQSGAEEVTVTCAEPVTLGADAANATEFWFVLPVMTFKKGFTVTVTDVAGESFSKSTDKSITLSRNTLSHMAAFKVELEGEEEGEEHVIEHVFEYDDLPEIIHLTWEEMNTEILEPLDLSQETFYQYYSGVVVSSELDKVYTMDPTRITNQTKSYMELVELGKDTNGFDEYEKKVTWPQRHPGVIGGYIWSGVWTGGDYYTTTDWAYVLLTPDFPVKENDTVSGTVSIKILSKDRYVYPNIIIRINFAVKHEHTWPNPNVDYLLGQDSEGRNIIRVKGRKVNGEVEFSASNREHFEDYLMDDSGNFVEFPNHTNLIFSLDQVVERDDTGAIVYDAADEGKASFSPNDTYWVASRDAGGMFPTFRWDAAQNVYVPVTTAPLASAVIYGSNYKNQKIQLTTPLIGTSRDYVVSMRSPMENSFICYNEYIARFQNIFKLKVDAVELKDMITPDTKDVKKLVTITDDAGKTIYKDGAVTTDGKNIYGLEGGDIDINYLVKNDRDDAGVSFGEATLEFDGSELTWENLGSRLVRDKVTKWWPEVLIKTWAGFNIADQSLIYPEKELTLDAYGKVTIKKQ